jgi:putative alpha-1,2-mannosidase
LQLGSGAALRIEASAFSERNLVADQVRLEGRVLDPKHLRYADLMQGGQLRFSMVPLPD